MKKQLASFLSVFLAAGILFSSTGIVVASHICLMKKKSEVSFYQKAGCCSKSGKPCESGGKETHHVKRTCCIYDLDYYKLDVSSVVKSDTRAVSIDLLSAPFSVELSLHDAHVSEVHDGLLNHPVFYREMDILKHIRLLRI